MNKFPPRCNAPRTNHRHNGELEQEASVCLVGSHHTMEQCSVLAYGGMRTVTSIGNEVEALSEWPPVP